jgi:hypothetical protein
MRVTQSPATGDTRRLRATFFPVRH